MKNKLFSTPNPRISKQLIDNDSDLVLVNVTLSAF